MLVPRPARGSRGQQPLRRAGDHVLSLRVLLFGFATASAGTAALAQCPVAPLLASDAFPGDYFGYSVACSGDTLVVGAPSPFGGTEVGGAHVLERAPTGWREVATLKAGDGVPGDAFGFSVATSAGRVLVGAYGSGGLGHSTEWGRAYVFEETPSGWRETAELGPVGAAAYDWFGIAVAVDGDRALISALGDDEMRGAVYAFERHPEGWVETQKLVAPNGAPGELFGSSVALDGDLAVVGSSLAAASGAAYVFERSGPAWALTAELTAPGSELFGHRVATASGWVFASRHVDSTEISEGGSVYAFRRESAGWTLGQILRAQDTAALHLFGGFLAAREGRLAVTAEDGGHGAAYVFELGAQGWFESAKLAPPNDALWTGFGRGMAFDENALVVGAFGGDASDATPGRAWVFAPLSPPQVYAYCEAGPNSVGDGARIGHFGTTHVARNDFHLTVRDAPPDAFGLVLFGGEQVHVPFDGGLLCVGPGAQGTFRLDPALQTDSNGELARHVDFTRFPAAVIGAGTAWNFQLWYRDPAGPGAGLFNQSDALCARFCP